MRIVKVLEVYKCYWCGMNADLVKCKVKIKRSVNTLILCRECYFKVDKGEG